MLENTQPQPISEEKRSRPTGLCFRTPELKRLGVTVTENPFNLPGTPYFNLSGLSDSTAEALNHLVPHLLCGEESAVLVFFHRSRNKADIAASELMWKIAGEEKVHEMMISKLGSILPPPERLEEIQKRAHDFFASLTSNDPVEHFAGISALDSGVCQIMSAVCSNHARIKPCATAYGIFSRILLEEASHVRFSHKYVIDRGLSQSKMNEIGEPIREGLANLLAPAGDSLETMGVDADRLFSRIRREHPKAA